MQYDYDQLCTKLNSMASWMGAGSDYGSTFAIYTYTGLAIDLEVTHNCL